MGIEPDRKPFERLPLVPELGGLPSFPTSSLESLSEIDSALRAPPSQLRFRPNESRIAAAAARLVLEGNRYRNKKHLDQAILSSKQNHAAFRDIGIELAREIAVPETISDHLMLVYDSFFFSDDLKGKITPNAEERALLSELYQEANRTGVTQAYWGANPCLDAAINHLAEHLNNALSPLMTGREPAESLPLCLLTGLLIRPLAQHFLAETFGAESRPAKEEGSVGSAALEIAKTVIYKVLVDQKLLGQTQEEASAQLRLLRTVDIRTTYITSEFPYNYSNILVNLSYVALDLHSLLVDWRALLEMSGFPHHPAVSKFKDGNSHPFVEAAIPLTAVAVLILDPEYEGARGMLLQGKVRGGVACLTKAGASGIVFQDPLVDATRSWSLPEALCISVDSAGKIFGSQESRFSTMASELAAGERVREIAHTLHHEANDELERLWQKHPPVFHFIDSLPFSLLLRDNERRILLYPELGSSLATGEIGAPLESAQVIELLGRIGLTSTYTLRGIELEAEANLNDAPSAPPLDSQPSDSQLLASRQSLSEYFIRHGKRRFSPIFEVLHQRFGVEERLHRGKGSHSLLFRNERGFPLPLYLRDSTEPFPLSYLKPLLRRLEISETAFVQAMRGE
jgi:hypothetical protein